MAVTRARTAEELRREFLDHLRALVRYWDKEDRAPSSREKLDGLVHSILTTIDGHSGQFPCALDLVCRTHPEDKAFQQDESEDWIEDGTLLNDGMLHEEWDKP